MFHSTSVLAALVPFVFASSITSGSSGNCSADFEICAPAGAETDSLGPIGSSTWLDLFSNIVDIVSQYGISHPAVAKTSLSRLARREETFCCSNVADCLLVAEVNIAMCWDRFTTNVFFPDGTYGTVVTGDFKTGDGASINLVYGDYTLANGTTGNIYDNNSASSLKPVTATMPIPSQWTSKGEGSAIPATGLGTTASLSTVTTTFPATTVAPSTGQPITVDVTVAGCNHCPAYNTVIPGPTQPGGTYPASTSIYSTGIITPSIVGSTGTLVSWNVAYTLTLAVVGLTVLYFRVY